MRVQTGGRTNAAAHAALLHGAEPLPEAGLLAAAALHDAQGQLARGQADGLGRRVLARDGVQERQVRAAACPQSHSCSGEPALIPITYAGQTGADLIWCLLCTNPGEPGEPLSLFR